MTQTWQTYQTQLGALIGIDPIVPIGHPGNRFTLTPHQRSFAVIGRNHKTAAYVVWLPGIRRDPAPARSFAREHGNDRLAVGSAPGPR